MKNTILTRFIPMGLALLAAATLAHAEEPAPQGTPAPVATPNSEAPPAVTIAGIASLQVYPAELKLTTAVDRERFVLVATYTDGITRDVTDKAKVTFAPEGVAKLDEELYINPVADGETTIEAEYEGQKASLKVAVKDAAVTPKKSFKLDVEPVLMRAGCNSGACHGAAAGKNGFKMTLFGFDPSLDYERLTRETKARRLTTADPDDSLILQKATTGVAHEGGERFKPGTPLYKTLETWIAEGANFDAPEVARVTGVEILPKQMVMYGKAGETAGERHRVTVRAAYSDGSFRDVTKLAILASLNDGSAGIDGEGFVTGKERGEAALIARFGTYAVATQAIVVPPNEPFHWPETVAEKSYIDELIDKKLKQMRMTPSDVCSDEVFARRVYLDIIGVPPKREESERFLADASPDKRAKLVDELLARPEFPELWAMKWAEMLRIESGSRRISFKAMYRYNTWLRDQIVAGVPMDKMVRDLLTANGGNFSNPAANFYMIETDPKLMAENVAQVFLGIRIQCAQCHNHPFERWKMDDYYSFSAFFAQIGRKGSEDPRETIVFNSGGGEVGHIKDGRAMPPKVLGKDEPEDLKGRDRRVVLADWITSPENPWFAKTFANRVWAHFMGRGIVDPPDDVRVSNPACNPELLDTLGKKFVESHYDIRALVRDICNSRVYQTSTHGNPTNDADLGNFSHRIPKRMPAEQLLDTICLVTETPEKFSRLPLGARAAQVADGNPGSYFLSIFGRPARTSACTCDRRNEPTLSQALHLINGSTIQARITNGNSRLARLLNEKKSTTEIAEDLYLAAYSRKPSTEEIVLAEKYVADSGDQRKGLEDLYWAVLNSKEFVFLH